MPNLTKQNKNKWWLADLGAGSGWLILAAWKAGLFSISVAATNGVEIAKANEPI